MASLYADENFPAEVVERLRQLGHDVVTAHEAGNANRGISDQQVLLFAHAQSRAVLTLDRRHFIGLHHAAPEHSGIIACSQDPSTEQQAASIHDALKNQSPLQGQLVRVYRSPH